eukprot:NODE_6584_length_446_cov_75.410579_g5017_i0.p3 GENE.NODE_6584_length_446_cov_75.410579_g5017_i0~~NODE_6584_length_446_cov_75.410579_g5017_i0.p3  ORF type:complete len:80 (+),score=18.81 NODE_6584_length_446_cov_75.410579_g5017_i0:24-242(+)
MGGSFRCVSVFIFVWDVFPCSAHPIIVVAVLGVSVFCGVLMSVCGRVSLICFFSLLLFLFWCVFRGCCLVRP